MGKKTTEEVETVETLVYYHGLLPREDLPYLLQNRGEYLLRSSEVKPGQDSNRQIILSVCVQPGNSITDRELKHIVIHRTPESKYCIDDRCAFESISGLLDYFKRTQNTVFVGKDVKIEKEIKQQSWELKHSDITLTKKLGEGAFGEVHQGILKKGGKKLEVAVKLAKNTAMTKEKIKEMMREARLMRQFTYHPNIVQLYGVAVEKEPLMIVMELVHGGALDEYLQKFKETTPTDRMDNMVCGAAFGLEYLHSQNIIHRDIAARNCLYSNGICKISDFGLSREGEKYVLQAVRKVPIKWLAPETILTLTYTQKTDVWSFGIFAWEVFAGLEPYPGMHNGEVKERVTNGYKMEFPIETPPDLVQIVTETCWAMDPAQRLTMKELVAKLCSFSGVTPPVIVPQSKSDQDNAPVVEHKEKRRKKGKNQKKRTKASCEFAENPNGTQKKHKAKKI